MKQYKPVLRMCTVCREMKDKRQLIRIVKNKEDAIFIDMTNKAAGRGAFVCNSKECLEKCKKQRAISRAFKCEVSSNIYDELIKLSAEKQV